MSDIQKILPRLAVYYLLLAVNIIFSANLIPDRFPTRNLSVIYLLILCVCLVLYHSHRVLRTGVISLMMRSISWMALLLILLRGIKYSAFAGVGILARHTWYFYYVPMLLIALFFFYISLMVLPNGEYLLPRGWYISLAVTVCLIVLVLTNDLHQLVFQFAPHFADWDNVYSYGKLFYVVIFWQYALYLAGIIILVIKCSISSVKKSAWIILLPFAIGTLMQVLLLTGNIPMIHGSNIIEFPESVIFTIATVLECCIQLGLIPTNTDYGKLFRQFSIAAQITDKKGTPVYISSAAKPLTAEQFSLGDGARIGAHTLLHKMEIPGGFGIWLDDISQLDRLNEELAQAKENLAQETELMRLQNSLKEKQTKIEQRTLVYDTIAARTREQSQAISRLAETARETEDIAVKEECRYHITLLGAYIKRFANLMLLSQDNTAIEAGELGLSTAEVLRYLNFCGVPSECFNSADCTIESGAALVLFEVFETLIERHLAQLRGVLVNLSEQKGTAVFKFNLENVTEPLTDDLAKKLHAAGILSEAQQESDVAYLCFTLPKGGEV